MTERLARSKRNVRRPPAVLVVLGLLGLAVFVVPLIGLLARTPWSDLATLLTGDIVGDAIRLSVISSLGATAISAVIGVPLAWMLARVEFPGRAIVRGLVLLPLVLPPVVGGAALLFALGRRGSHWGAAQSANRSRPAVLYVGRPGGHDLCRDAVPGHQRRKRVT